jgi:protein-S-isoprenylcysteine O-methyltransferase Ste14
MSDGPSPSPAVALTRPSAVVERLGQFVFRYRDYLVPAGFLIALVFTRPQPVFGSEHADAWLDALAVAVSFAGQALRILVIGYAYIKRGGANKRLAAPKLVCEGFYAHSRNPMYAGNIFLMFGLCLIYNSTWVYLVGLPIVVVALLAIVLAEERYLDTRFGADYAAYCERVNRFLPRLRGLRATMRGMRFDWRRVLQKEYGTTFAWVSAAFFLLAWERLIWHGWDGARPDIAALALFYCPVPVAYGVARWLKKSGRLRSLGLGAVQPDT